MDRFKKYLDYIDNTGGSPTVAEFDEDWEPIGQAVRVDMMAAGLIEQRDGRIHKITDPGRPVPHHGSGGARYPGDDVKL